MEREKPKDCCMHMGFELMLVLGTLLVLQGTGSTVRRWAGARKDRFLLLTRILETKDTTGNSPIGDFGRTGTIPHVHLHAQPLS